MSNVLAGKCQECVHANSKTDCEGLTKAEFDANPCHKYKFDASCVENETEDEQTLVEDAPEQEGPTEETIIEKEKTKSEQIVDVAITKQKETPAEKFIRISNKRLERCRYELKLMAQLGRLSVTYTRKDGSKALAYEFTHEQVATIANTLQNAVDSVKIELTQYAQ